MRVYALDVALIHFKKNYFNFLFLFSFHLQPSSYDSPYNITDQPMHYTHTEPFHSTLDSVIKSSSKNSSNNSSNSNIDSAIKPTTASKLSEQHSSSNNFLNDFDVKIEDNHTSNQLKNEIWFHGPISREQSEILVSHDGDFLVRQSKGCAGQFVLTGMQDGIRKHLLLVDAEGVVSVYLCTILNFKDF